MSDFDLAIVGGGINGVGIARDAAGRGQRVVLFEQNDLASGTSSAAIKRIHGGLRYLAHGPLRLVREALIEREVLLRMAPHAIRLLRFVLPRHSALRPAWLLRLGLFLYDHLGGRTLLPATRRVDLASSERGAPLKPRYRVLGAASRLQAAGGTVGPGLTVAEVRRLQREESAETAEDVLWRRSKLGLHLNADEQRALAQFMANQESGRAAE
jgi:glycerol-3-phosphate dehydrogenase